MTHINKLNRFMENTSKMTFNEKKNSCRINIGIVIIIIRNLELNLITIIIISQ